MARVPQTGSATTTRPHRTPLPPLPPHHANEEAGVLGLALVVRDQLQKLCGEQEEQEPHEK